MGSRRGARKQGSQKKGSSEKSSSKLELFSLPKQRTLVFSLVLIVVTLAAYSPIVHNSLVNFDDGPYILDTPQIRLPLGRLLRWAFTTFAQGNWHPITWLSHALDYQLFDSSPVATHVVNVAIHVLSAVLLFLLLQDVSGKALRSLSVAALYALHPLNVESVAWASERKSVLSMFFFMVALWAYGRYVRHRTTGRYLGMAAAFVFGLMAKPQVVTFPFVLLLWDYWPLGRWRTTGESRSRLVAEKIPLFFLSAACSVLTWRAQSASGAVRTGVHFSFLLRLENAIVAYARYLGKTVWPFNLAAMYPYPFKGFSTWQIVSSSLLLVMISALVLAARRRPYLLMGWLWFLGTLVPMIGLVQVGQGAMADRYAYLPLLGLLIGAVWGVTDWLELRPIPESWPRAALAVVLLLFGVLTYRQVGYWRDSESLWTHAIQVTHDNYVAYDNLAGELDRQEQAEAAVEQSRHAVAIYPEDWLAHLYIGNYEGRQKNYPAAVEHLSAAFRYTSEPNNVEWKEFAYAGLGTAYRKLQNYSQAREAYQASLRINPANHYALLGMGLVAHEQKNFPEAIRWYSEAMRNQPDAVASLLMAKAMQENGQMAESKDAYQKARSLTTDLNAAQRTADEMLSPK